jgi:hypothetical protein
MQLKMASKYLKNTVRVGRDCYFECNKYYSYIKYTVSLAIKSFENQ